MRAARNVVCVRNERMGRPSQALCLTHATYSDADFYHGLLQLMVLPVRCSAVPMYEVCKFNEQHGRV